MIYGRVLLGMAREIQTEYNKAGLVAQQALSSIRTVYSFVAERRTVSAFSAALDRSVQLGLWQGFVKGLALGGSCITYTISALLLWYGSLLAMYYGADGGTIFATSGCIVTGGVSFGLGISNVKYFGEAMAAAERMEEVIVLQPSIDSESEEGEKMERVEGEVEFKEVRFAYPARKETEIFRGFSLRVEAGKTLALVGGSGSGKSTAIALLQRFYDLDGGEITLDGVDIMRLRLKWLRAQMGLVSQEPALFATTIKENILLGKEDAAMDEVVAAAKAANAHGFISELPLGYDTQVGERGVQMSGGQKQRLAIARAIVRAPKILLLDEATSALDSTSENIVQAALDAVSVGRTTLVIAHRFSTIRNADSIAFIQAGQVTELGSHDQLLTNLNGHYSTLFRIQQSHPPPDDQHANIGATDRSSRSSHSISRRISTSSSTQSTGETRWGEDEKNQKDQD
ncbi:putative multidrug resistance protein [Platanthera guangdongensis]|uniref:Multidrug resistance protein n=1 Tax=Platanthera guangdongensis TaxID=2320717 RepID=A0ABR2MP83_9ASPA